MTIPSLANLTELLTRMAAAGKSADDMAGAVLDLFPPSPDVLAAVVDGAHTGAPQVSVESAILAYQSAQTAIERYELVKGAAKQLIAEVMEETAQTKYVTRAGIVTVTSPSTSISYDGKALDVLCQADADLALKLFPYRKEVQRAGTLRISAAR